VNLATRWVLPILLLSISQVLVAHEQQPAQVMLFGVFHFSNPGADVVKTDQIDVMTDENQAYLEALSARISNFNPTVVLLEFSPEQEPTMQERFEKYVQGQFELPSNEVYQLGFRVAALSEADTIHGFDETNVQWKAEPLFEYLENVDTQTNARMSALIEETSRDQREAHGNLSLAELLERTNDPDLDARNRSLYILTNHVGDHDNFVGADAAASWWHRNFRMYAYVQRYAKPGERVLVIGGQGHIAILRQFLADDPDRTAVDVRPYLRE
jgi:hypothetical protein